MQINTERLTLRPISIADLETTHAYAGDLENTKYMMFLPNQSIEETAAWLRESEAMWRSPAPHHLEFAILLEGAHTGSVTLYPLADGRVELGWILNKAYQGHGYALEAARAAIEYGKNALGARRFFAQCDSENAGSYRLMERLGMRRVSCLPGRKNRSMGDMERMELTYEVEYDQGTGIRD